MWVPISLDDLNYRISASMNELKPHERQLWEMVRVPPTKWQLHPWGDTGGGFWVVGIVGQRAIWFNDIEDGFDLSRFSTFGKLDDYLCNQYELEHVLCRLCEYIVNPQAAIGSVQGPCGPPESINGCSELKKGEI